eukprot:gnl/TRDRNA2_/TRDRNA2_192028_c0_seq1.p1 gnl/TRDRNA2_/TRDRNA2_192028_c0~~gnl/TRDRNA2_/TRDRNA2_192028_c0_seq1.p1  ORF type:complete len:452 (+),score=93.42 gnl/TRDRNA2_/TRDRNA2_192028_c0_seq1:75-1358(+)
MLRPDTTLPDRELYGQGFVLVSDAGTPQANGIYKATAKDYCEAPIYEHLTHGEILKITREPHTNPKTGQVKHGWLLGLSKKPLYGRPTEDLFVVSKNDAKPGWKNFNGALPLPTVQGFANLVDLYHSIADGAKTAGDAASEREDWAAAQKAFSRGVEALKESPEQSGENFKSRGAVLMGRRANVNLKLKDYKAALRDAIVALEFVRGLASAEAVAKEAALALGPMDENAVQKMLDAIGEGNILDPTSPLVTRCVDRWIEDNMDVADFNKENPENLQPVPAPVHMQADRYLDGVDDETRYEIFKKHIPGMDRKDGGAGIVPNAAECLVVMKQFEEALDTPEFTRRKQELWDQRGLSYPARLLKTREMIAEELTDVLVPLGFAPGTPGLARCMKQMQKWWSEDMACANKAMDLEEIADVSLADLGCEDP